MPTESGYKSYIVRVWQVERNGQMATVAALEDCQTNQRRAFASLAALQKFLETEWRPLPVSSLQQEEG
ncbi:MAG: hypothetical protein JXM73_10515 [Anaerolineae bacterium]|nr:hypothetical protein [Anaerolineae bacterium]